MSTIVASSFECSIKILSPTWYFKGFFLKKLQTCKPDSVVGLHLSVLGVAPKDQAAYPVTCLLRLERAALQGYYTWHFSVQGLPASFVTKRCRGLLPHVFILTFIAKGSYFLWHLLSSVT
jgi:hypothetical protein